MDWNYYNTFITVAADCPVEHSVEPPDKKETKSKPRIEFELVAEHPYKYTQEEVLFETHIRHKGIPPAELERAREEFYSKPKPCMRASMLPKKYGWGLHFDTEGRLALVPMESPQYRRFVEGEAGGVKLLAAMRNSRKEGAK